MKLLLYGYGISNKSVRSYCDLNNIEYIIYTDSTLDIENNFVYEALLNEVDIVVKSAGIKFNTSFLKYVYKKRIKVLTDLGLYYQIIKPKDSIVCTGSVGKTTVVSLINSFLDGKTIGVPIGNCGNPLFDYTEEDVKVIEASSFTLHNSNITPKVYVLTNIIPHHLDYHLSFNSYIKDKIKTIRNMTFDDYIVYSKDDKIVRRLMDCFLNVNKVSFSLNEKADCFYLNNRIYYKNEFYDVPDSFNEKFNIYNLMASICVAKLYEVEKKKICFELERIKKPSFRFERVVDSKNVVIINDSKSTTPFSTYNALLEIINKYPKMKKTLILGGIPKEDYSLIKELVDNIDDVYIFGLNIHLFKEIFKDKRCFYYKTLNEVVENLSFTNRCILFSPSCVSYDQYRNFEERGKHFNNLIEKYHFNEK